MCEACNWVGHGEQPKGSNRGPLPDRCLEYVGYALGNPWCAAFACYMAFRVGIKNGPKTASTGAIYEWGRRNHKVLDPKEVRAGDLGLVRDNTSKTGFRHTVIVRKVLPFGMVMTIEGNYGDTVQKGLRRMSTMDFVRAF